MAIGVALFVLAVLIIAIYLIIELKRLKHKIFAILLIGLILFSYVSASLIYRNHDIDFKTVPGVIEAGKLYFSWLFSVFGNVKEITGKIIKMDWGGNSSKNIREKFK